MSASVIIGRLLESSLLNLELFAVTLLLGLPLGLIIAFGSMSRFKPLKWLTRMVVGVIRGTPLMLQILLVSFLPVASFTVQRNLQSESIFVPSTKTVNVSVVSPSAHS